MTARLRALVLGPGCRHKAIWHEDRDEGTPPTSGLRRFPLRCSVVAIVALAFVCGCTKSRPVESDILRLSQRNEPTDLDPATASLPDEFFVIRALSEGLLVPNPAGGAPLPAAAESYDVSARGDTYTFHLRRGAQWSNGEPVTSDDFIASFRRVLTPRTGAPKADLLFAVKNARAFYRGDVGDFATVGFKALDANTLVITLEHADPAFPLYVASGAWMPVNPRAVARFERAWTRPENYVGNGPFTLAEWRSQQRIVVRKNPHYRDAARIRIGEIQFIRFDNKDSEERAYRAGQVDVTMAVPEAKLDVYSHERPAELHRAPLAETRFLAFNLARPPLNDPRVRRALSLAIDREKLTALVLHGGQEPAEYFLSPALRGDADRGRGRPPGGPELHDSNGTSTADRQTRGGPEVDPTPCHRFDPSVARALLADAGFPNGRGFPHLELSGWDRNPVLEAMQRMWKETLGIEISLAVREAKVHLAALHAGEFDVAFVTNLLDVRDPTSALHDFTHGASNNFPHWSSAEFDTLVEAASRSASTADALARDAEAERILLTAAPIAPLYFNTQNWLMSPRVHDWEQDPLWTRRYNDVWMDR